MNFAIKMEMDGKIHYEALAGKCQIHGLRKIFSRLAADEQKHYEICALFDLRWPAVNA